MKMYANFRFDKVLIYFRLNAEIEKHLFHSKVSFIASRVLKVSSLKILETHLAQPKKFKRIFNKTFLASPSHS